MQVLPEEVERYEGNAAIVLAHIRFRCSGSDAIERDGFRWWRVSHTNLGREVGLSRKSVMKALQKLGGAVVAANNSDEPRDQTRAYRPADNIHPLTSQSPDWDRSDAAESRTGRDRSQTGQVPVPNGTGTGPNRDSALPSGELEKKEQEPPSPPSAEASPEHTAESANGAGEQSNLPDVIDAEIVPEERGQERGRSNPVDVSASRLVSMLIPANTPAAVKTALRLKASELIRGDGVPPEVVAEALRRWQARPDAGVGLLPYIASEVLREGTAPPPRSKLRDWHNLTERLTEIEREYLERHPDGAGLNEHVAAVFARESGPAPTSKARTVAEWAREAREAEQQEPGPASPPPPAIEAKAAPNPRPAPPPWVPGPDGSPRCRVHAHLRATPPGCDRCRRAAEAAAGESA